MDVRTQPTRPPIGFRRHTSLPALGQEIARLYQKPAPILPLLETIKDDEEEHVLRSVAKNLNDIAKDNPDMVAKIARRWLKGASKDREKLVCHACRTLIKQGHQKTLKALGYGPPRIKLEKLKMGWNGLGGKWKSQ